MPLDVPIVLRDAGDLYKQSTLSLIPGNSPATEDQSQGHRSI
jgi:hypothetical protein